MVTLQDIADRVGVSTVTVSKVLRGKVKGSWAKSAARVQKIHATALEMGYQVDWRAKALKSKRTNMIGLLSTERPQTRTHDPHLLDGLIETLGAAGYNIVFYRVPSQRSRIGFADMRFDGVVIDYHIEPEEIALIEQTQLPAVIVNAPSVSGVPSLMPDHILAGQRAARHLIELGHRRIAYLQPTARQSKLWPQHMVRMWREGIRLEMKNAGLPGGYADVIPSDECDDDVIGAAAFVPQLEQAMRRPDRPTAIVACAPGLAAQYLLNPLLDLGFACPRDVSVFSMGDDDALAWCRPRISALPMPFYELGRAAASALLAQIPPEDAAAPRLRPGESRLPLEIVIRESTGAPAAEPRRGG